MLHDETSDILVSLSHPHGDIEVPLSEWITHGPGARKYLKPTSVKRASTNEKLPITVIPIQYRNTFLSRMLIYMRFIPKPWTH